MQPFLSAKRNSFLIKVSSNDPSMHELILEDISYWINDVQIADKINLRMQGLCSIQYSTQYRILNEISHTFSKTHMYSPNKIVLTGAAYFNGFYLPCEKFNYLLNHHMIYENNSIVQDILNLINSREANEIARSFEVNFLTKRIGELSIVEIKVLEVIVSVASHTRLIYLPDFSVFSTLKSKILKYLKQYTREREAIVLIETEYEQIFDSAICFTNEKFICLDKKECEAYYRDQALSIFDIPRPMGMENSEDLLARKINDSEFKFKKLGVYDYKKIFEKYATENLVDFKHKNISFFTRIFYPCIYRVQIQQALHMGYVRFMTIHNNLETRTSCILKTIGPFISIILFLKISQEFYKCDHFDLLMDFLCHGPDLYRSFIKVARYLSVPANTVLTYLFVFFLKKYWNIFYNIFQGGFNTKEYNLILMAIFFSIFYQYSSIFEEESQLLNYTINITITPGTYILSILVYIFLAHMLTFIAVCHLFNTKSMFIYLIYCTFTNFIFALFIGKRLRVYIIAFYLAMFLFSYQIFDIDTASSLIQRILITMFSFLFPPAIFNNNLMHFDNLSNYKDILFILIYCIFYYFLFCAKIFKF